MMDSLNLKCLIVDDEMSAINVLTSYVEKTPFLELQKSFTDPLEALLYLQTHEVDLLFLDIQMPNLSGLELMKTLEKKTNVIITTAYSEFAVDGFELNAIDYLLKPISFDRFLKASQKAISKQETSSFMGVPTSASEDYMFVKTESKGKYVKIDYDDILFVESLKNYVSIYTPDQRIITYASMKEMEQKLPFQFVRVHKSYIVCLQHIQALDGNQIFLQDMKYVVPIGETYRSNFFTHLNENTMGGKK